MTPSQAPLGAVGPATAEPTAEATLRGALPAKSQKALRESPFAVLVPSDVRLLSKTTILRGPKWASFTFQDSGATVSLYGTQTVHTKIQPTNHPPGTTVRGVTAWTGTNEGMPFISWQEDGTAWMLEVECESREDTRCTGDGYANKLVESLVPLRSGAGGAQ